jgi:hypothetical protein
LCRGGVYFRTERWVCFLLYVLVDHTSLEARRVITATADTSDLIPSFLSVALICRVVTGAFDTSCFDVALVVCVPISLLVFKLDNILFMFQRFEFYFTLLYVFYVEYGLDKRHGERKLVLCCLKLRMFVTVCPRFCISALISVALMK